GNKLTDDIFNYIKKTGEEESVSVSQYALMIGSLQTISSHVSALSSKIFKHTNNNHRVPTSEESSELIEMETKLQELIQNAATILKEQKFSEYANFEQSIDNFKDMLQKFNKQQIKRIKKHQSGSRQSLIFVNTLSKVERIVEQIKNIIKANTDAKVDVQA
ncbi:hypothetical protein JW964_20610, partial [candidate division KSB1 bacterium]|nr:hypothetical protein [candidate division KSB1 bacterium]